MGNNHAKTLVLDSSRYDKRPHSVLGFSPDERFHGSDYGDSRPKKQSHHKGDKKGKALLPPLPRSHSFHQILRPTENGANLAQKGTIRGFDQMRHQVIGSGRGGAAVMSEEEIVNPELIAILKNRRCKSETDLLRDDEDGSENGAPRNRMQENGKPSDGARKAFSSGVAAKIQKAKYKAPLPPGPPSSSNPHGAPAISNSGAQASAQSVLTTFATLATPPSSSYSGNYSQQQSESQPQTQAGYTSGSHLPSFSFGSNERASNQAAPMKHRSQANGASTKHLHESLLSNDPMPDGEKHGKPQNNGLLRRLSEKSPYLITRAKEVSKAENNVSQSSGQATANGVPLIPRLKLTNANLDSRKDRNLIFDSSNSKPPRTPAASSEAHLHHSFAPSESPLLNELKAKQQLAQHSSQSKQDDGGWPFDRTFLDQLEMNFSRPRNHPNAEPEKFELSSARHKTGADRNSQGSMNRSSQPSFDDNFILRRATPTAGLKETSPARRNLSPSALNGSHGRPSAHHQRNSPFAVSNELLTKSHERVGLLGSSPQPKGNNCMQFKCTPSNNGTRFASSPLASSQPHQLPQPQSLSHQAFSPLPQPSQAFARPTPPPPLDLMPVNGQMHADDTDQPHHGRALGPAKYHNHNSYVSVQSDSANYSDEEEEEIKIVLKPRLPPPRRPLFLSPEKNYITDDFFTTSNPLVAVVPTQGARRHQCWTPMEDLTSSEDDDGVHCDQQSEDYDLPPNSATREVRELLNSGESYDTRFTLQNQLRTLIQNNRLRQKVYT